MELAARGAPDCEPTIVTERVLERVAWALRNLAKDKITRPKVAAAGGAEQLVALAARATHRGVLEEVRFPLYHPRLRPCHTRITHSPPCS